jgi:peptidoglycan biosynthesis protein MviN/MurJ (putative lipid II flippase)
MGLFVDPNQDPQLAVLAWVVLAGLVACVVSIVALLRSGRIVPLLGEPPRDAPRDRLVRSAAPRPPPPPAGTDDAPSTGSLLAHGR